MNRLVSVIVPVLNEEEAIPGFQESMQEVGRNVEERFGGSVRLEFLFVNDGSTDGTLAKLLELQGSDPRIRVIDFSRNFGKEAALTAGITEAKGDALILIDADLQDPPELMVQMIEKWLDGSKVVLARRNDRSDDSFLKRTTASWFYSVHNLISNITIPLNVGDFRLLDREVAEATKQLPENRRFMKGIFAWVGFEPTYIDYHREPRASGVSKFSGWKLWRFAVEGITSFSDVPLVIWTYIGVLISSLAMAYASFIVGRTLIFGVDVPGFASILVGILFLGGIQILGIGILGEYIGRIYSEVKRRPAYLVARRYEAAISGDEDKSRSDDEQGKPPAPSGPGSHE